jgi:hypothetical protein
VKNGAGRPRSRALNERAKANARFSLAGGFTSRNRSRKLPMVVARVGLESLAVASPEPPSAMPAGVRAGMEALAFDGTIEKLLPSLS